MSPLVPDVISVGERGKSTYTAADVEQKIRSVTLYSILPQYVAVDLPRSILLFAGSRTTSREEQKTTGANKPSPPPSNQPAKPHAFARINTWCGIRQSRSCSIYVFRGFRGGVAAAIRTVQWHGAHKSCGWTADLLRAAAANYVKFLSKMYRMTHSIEDVVILSQGRGD